MISQEQLDEALRIPNHPKPLVIAPHAKTRWAERGYGTLEAALRDAIPWGGQKGTDDLLYFHEETEVVFAVRRLPGRHDIVRTVLTKDHAIANMQRYVPQAARLVFETPAPPPIKNDYAVVDLPLPRDARGADKNLVQRLREMKELEQSLRQALERMRRHANLVVADNRALKDAMRQTLSEDQVQAVFAAADALRDERKKGTDNAGNSDPDQRP